MSKIIIKKIDTEKIRKAFEGLTKALNDLKKENKL